MCGPFEQSYGREESTMYYTLNYLIKITGAFYEVQLGDNAAEVTP